MAPIKDEGTTPNRSPPRGSISEATRLGLVPLREAAERARAQERLNEIRGGHRNRRASGKGSPSQLGLTEKGPSQSQLSTLSNTTNALNTNLLFFDPAEVFASIIQENDDKIDVTALDRYNDEVRTQRRILIDICREVPFRQVLIEDELEKLENAVRHLCRSTYFGTIRAQTLAIGTVPLLVWILERKCFNDNFIVNVMRSVAEMMWTSSTLKSKFAEDYGPQTIFRIMRMVHHNPRLGTWGCYALAMISVGSPDVILSSRSVRGMEELVAELSFEMYWYDWPANFGLILQGILFGPQSVTAHDDLFQFV